MNIEQIISKYKNDKLEDFLISSTKNKTVGNYLKKKLKEYK